jgi:hypothetical protein
MSVTIKFRRGNSAEWTSNGNVILASGEPGYELDTGRFKIGNGTTNWNNLTYAAIVPTGFLAGSGISINLATNGAFATINSSGATISNYGNDRVLTSDGTTTGINGESNLTFNGSLLSVSGNFVANTGTINSLNFNNIGDPDLSIRQLAWNNSEGSLALGLSDTYEMFLGGELHYRVRNNTGSSILAGTAVYATGLTPGGNNRIEIAPKAADGSIREVRFMGLVTENIDNGVNGFTTHFGYIRNIDTRGDYAANGATNKVWASGEPVWAEGDLLYVHPTVAGKLTKIEPKHSISVAIILNRHQNQGKLFVRPTSYGHLGDNHDVSISGVSNGQFLQYNSSTDYWVASNSGNFTTLTINNNQIPVGTGLANHIAYWNTTSGLVADSGQLYWDATNNRLGIGTQSPVSSLQVVGTGRFTNVDINNSAIAGTSALTVNGSISTQSQAVIGGQFSAYGDTNTRVYKPDASTFAMSSANSGIKLSFGYLVGSIHTPWMTITNSGIGIGTTSPAYNFHVIGTGNFSQNVLVNGTGVSLSGHTHTTSQITNFNSGVSGLVSGIYAPLISPSLTGTPTAPTATSGTNTTQIATTAFVRTEVSNLVASAPSALDTLNELAAALGNDPNFATTVTNNLSTKIAGTGTTNYIPKFTAAQTIQNSIIFDNGTNIGIGTTSPSSQLHVIGTGNFSQNLLVNGTGVSVSGHTHAVSDITNFNSSVSGLLPVKNIGSGSGINVSSTTGNFTISVSGLNSTYISDFNEAVDDRIGSGLFVAGTGINLNYNDIANTFTVSVTGVSFSGHTHTSSNITDFNSSVSGLLPTIANSGDNRILTSTGSAVGINGESNLTFNGTFLNVTGSGAFSSNLRLDSQTANTIVGFDANKNITSLSTATYPSLTELSYVKGVTSALQTQLNAKQNTLTNPVTGIGVSGHIAYWNSTSGIVADSGQLYWDAANNRLGIGTTSPSYNLEVSGTGSINTLRINKFDYTNLSVSTGLADNDLLVAIADPSGLATTQTIQGNILRNSLLNQPARLQFRQGTDTERLLITPASGEPIWTTDSQKFYIGDGATVGGDFVGPSPLERVNSTDSFVPLLTYRGTTTLIVNEIIAGGRPAYNNSILGGDNNLITSYAVRLTGIDSTISFTNGPVNSLSCILDDTSRWNNTQTSGIRIDYYFSNIEGGAISNQLPFKLTTYATLSSSTTSGNALILNFANPVGVSGETWRKVRIINMASGVFSNNWCSIVNGNNNTISSSIGSTIAGGHNNFILHRPLATSVGSSAFIGGGRHNLISMGLTGSSLNTAIIGGTFNSIRDGNNNVIVGGQQNSISLYINDILTGSPFVPSISNIFIGGGLRNLILSSRSAIVGGEDNICGNAFNSIILGGSGGKTIRRGEVVNANGFFTNPGDAQHSSLVAKLNTTDNTTNLSLTLDGVNKINIPEKTTCTFEIKLSAYNDTDAAAAGWIFRGVIKRNGSNTTSLVGSVIEENWKDASMNNTTANVVADDTNEALDIRVTGLTGKNIRWVAVVDISQVSYGVV